MDTRKEYRERKKARQKKGKKSRRQWFMTSGQIFNCKQLKRSVYSNKHLSSTLICYGNKEIVGGLKLVSCHHEGGWLLESRHKLLSIFKRKKVKEKGKLFSKSIKFMCVCVCVCVCVCACAHVHVCACIHACMCVWVCVHVCVCLCVQERETVRNERERQSKPISKIISSKTKFQLFALGQVVFLDRLDQAAFHLHWQQQE